MQKKKKQRAKRTTDWPRMIHISCQSPKYLLNNAHKHPRTSPSCRQNNNFRLIIQKSEITHSKRRSAPLQGFKAVLDN